MSYIGVFDSGVGGITTLAQARRMLPQENFIYYADTAHMPYGGRPRGEVLALTRACVEEMRPLGLTALLIACNAATSAAAAELRAELDIPVLGLEPAIKPALMAVDGPVVALGTQLTVRGEKFANLLAALQGAERVIPVACPGLVELIEADPRQAPIETYLRRLLAPYQDSMRALVLGCTHYIFLRPLLARLWPDLPLFDGNEGVSRNLARVVGVQTASEGETQPVGQTSGQLCWRCSEKTAEAQQRFADKCQRYYDYCR